MARFKPENDAFRMSEAMRFLCNLLANNNKHVDDDDVFAAPALLTTVDEIRTWYKTTVPDSVRRKIEKADRNRDSVCFTDSRPELLRCLWCPR